jgi:hydrogenase-4 component B
MISFLSNDFCSIGLSFKADGFRLLYAGVSVLVFIVCTLFAAKYLKDQKKNTRFYISWVLTFLCTLGLLFAGDLFTCFMFFEIMSLASVIWVLQRETYDSDNAGRVYLRISVICGMVMLYGLFLVQHEFGTLDFDRLTDVAASAEVSKKLIPAILISVGFGAKAGVFLLHVWLPKAYVQAVAPGTAFLSALLSKAGIIGIILTSSCLGVLRLETWGNMLLILGACTMVTGAFLAIFTNDLKRTVACSSLSQIGFIVTGVACMVLEPGGLAFTGTLLHMLNHTLIKTALFIGVGAIYAVTKTLDLNELKGYGRKNPLLMITFGVSGLSLAGVPGFSGFVSKNMMHEALDVIAETSDIAKAVSVIFTLTGGMTLCYMLKLFICLFVEKGQGEDKEKPETRDELLFTIPTLLVFAAGILPIVFAKIPSFTMLEEYDRAAAGVTFEEVIHFGFFAPAVIKATAISVTVGIALYFLCIRLLMIDRKNNRVRYRAGLPGWFDLEAYVYRPVFMYFLTFIGAFVARLFDKLTDLIIYFFRKKVFKPLKHKRSVTVGNSFTYGLGTILDRIVKTDKKPGKVSYVTRLALFSEQTASMARMIERSLSLSMLLFSTGLVITLIYMLFK